MSWIMSRRYAWPILVALVMFTILNAAASPAFTNAGNWNGMLVGAAPFIITAMAQTAASCRATAASTCLWDRSRASSTHSSSLFLFLTD